MSPAMRNLVMTMISLIPVASVFGQTVTTSPASSEPATAMTLEVAHNKLEHGQEREAIDALQQLAAAKPPVKGANRELGIAYYRTAKLVDAEQSFAAAMVEDPNDGKSVQMRVLTLYRLGRPTAALPYLVRSPKWKAHSEVDVTYVTFPRYIQSPKYTQTPSR